VLDASGLLAWLQGEPGMDNVTLEGAVINSVNWSEVVQKAEQNGVAMVGIREELGALGLDLRGFSLEEGQKAAEFYPLTKAHGLSLGDRACLATAFTLSGTAITAEQVWSRAEHGVPVRVIR
jgi:PIN domain nuclease of toxin-antitoxin system